jgi:large subunit ribosomal protein L6
MSRIGKMPIEIPAGVKIEVNGQDISVTGKKGSLSRTVRPEIGLKVEDNQRLDR